MEGFTEEGKAVGLIFDVSLRHEKDGRRLIDTLKKSIIKIIKDCIEDDVDVFYLYHPEIFDPVYLNGEKSCAVGNYQTDGWIFNLGLAIKQTLYVLSSQDNYLRKYLIYITDRNENSHPIEKALYLSKKDMIEVNFILIGIGDHYDKKSMSILAESDKDNITYFHLPNAASLTSSLFKENINGEINICSTTDE